jgi:hypothetical protein
VSDKLSVIAGLALIAGGVYYFARGTYLLALLFLLAGTALSGSSAGVPPWAKVALFLSLLIAALAVFVLAL